MDFSTELRSFIREHANDDTNKLLLAATRFPDIDVPYAIDQILARRQIREKLPYWYANEDLIYPSRLSAEQCSSEFTARYKQQLLRGDSVCDLTGGLGIDTFYFSQQAAKVTYIERFPEYCEAAKHNFTLLGASNIRIENADVRELLPILKADTFYIDPARRTDRNKRAFALSDCEPDVLQLKPILLEQTQRLIVKISPMADIEETLRLLPETKEIHILSLKNECKELLFILERQGTLSDPLQVKIFAINLKDTSLEQPFCFTLEEEKNTPLQTTDSLKQYLYEPHSALLKSGAFKLISSRFNLSKLHQHSHLYSSDQLYRDFPGRIFKIDQTFEFSGKLLKQINKSITKANITTRNFPLTVSELRNRSHIKEGGDLYLFATTLANEQKVLILSHKVIA